MGGRWTKARRGAPVWLEGGILEGEGRRVVGKEGLGLSSGGPRLPGSEYRLIQLAVQSLWRLLEQRGDMSMAGLQRR